jgi:hypothetical protein
LLLFTEFEEEVNCVSLSNKLLLLFNFKR